MPLGPRRYRLAIRLPDDRDPLLFRETSEIVMPLCASLPPNREPVSHVIRGSKSRGQVIKACAFFCSMVRFRLAELEVHPFQCRQRALLSFRSKLAEVSVYLRSFNLIWLTAKLPRALRWPPHICPPPFQWKPLPASG